MLTSIASVTVFKNIGHLVVTSYYSFSLKALEHPLCLYAVDYA